MKDDKSTPFDHNVSVELYSGQHRLGDAKINRIPSVCNDGTIVRLAAKALILELHHTKLPSSNKEDMIDSRQIQCEEHGQQQTTTSNDESKMTKEKIKERIIQISLEHNILSPFTAFVGIEKRVNASNADMVLREVPIEISADNQYSKYLETRMSQMRHEQAKSQMRHEQAMSQMCYASLHERYDYAAERYHQEYDKARWQLNEAHNHYAESERHYTTAEQHYCEARNDYEKAQQNLKHSEDKKKSSSTVSEEPDLQHEKACAQMLLTEAVASLKHWEHEKASAHESLMRQKHEMQSAERRMHMIREDLSHWEHEKRSAQMHYQMARASLGDDNRLSSEMHYVEALQRYEHEKRPSKKSRAVVRNDDQGEQDIVRHLIHQQKFDGLWDVDAKVIVQLTGKSLSDFQQLDNTEMLMSAIIIVVLETHFTSLSSMWYGIVQKARKRLIDMLDKDNNKLDALLDDIRKQL
jgi:predicted  nucleic acid-binding Zn-ribbon protein